MTAEQTGFFVSATSTVSRWECFSCGRAQPMQHPVTATADDLWRLAEHQHHQRAWARHSRSPHCVFRRENVAIRPYLPRDSGVPS